MARAIALIALVALGLFGETFHEPFHGGGTPRLVAVTFGGIETSRIITW